MALSTLPVNLFSTCAYVNQNKLLNTQLEALQIFKKIRFLHNACNFHEISCMKFPTYKNNLKNQSF